MCCPWPCWNFCRVTPVHLDSTMQPGRWQNSLDPASGWQLSARVSLYACALGVVVSCYRLFCLTQALHPHLLEQTCRLQAGSCGLLPASWCTDQWSGSASRKELPKRNRSIRLDSCQHFSVFHRSNDHRKEPFLTVLLDNLQLSLPSGCLCAPLSELQETGESTWTTLVPWNWVATSLRWVTCRVGLVHCKPPLPIKGETPLPVLSLCVCCCPSLLQLCGKLNQKNAQIKAIPAWKHWHGGGQSCLQQWHPPASVAGETRVVLCLFGSPWHGFGWSTCFASVPGLALWQGHPHGSSIPCLPGRSGANRDL